MRLEKKVALISGGASGMGAAEAMLFAREGAAVVIADILDAEGQSVVDAMASAGGGARYAHLDVTREADWHNAIASAVDGFGRLDVLVNNAGISGTIDPDLLSTTAWDRIM